MMIKIHNEELIYPQTSDSDRSTEPHSALPSLHT